MGWPLRVERATGRARSRRLGVSAAGVALGAHIAGLLGTASGLSTALGSNPNAAAFACSGRVHRIQSWAGMYSGYIACLASTCLAGLAVAVTAHCGAVFIAYCFRAKCRACVIGLAPGSSGSSLPLASSPWPARLPGPLSHHDDRCVARFCGAMAGRRFLHVGLTTRPGITGWPQLLTSCDGSRLFSPLDLCGLNHAAACWLATMER